MLVAQVEAFPVEAIKEEQLPIVGMPERDRECTEAFMRNPLVVVSDTSNVQDQLPFPAGLPTKHMFDTGLRQASDHHVTVIYHRKRRATTCVYRRAWKYLRTFFTKGE